MNPECIARFSRFRAFLEGLRGADGEPLYAVTARDRGVAGSTFHHFADYNWDPELGAPSFVTEPPGRGLAENPGARRSTERYVSNLARWLGGA